MTGSPPRPTVTVETRLDEETARRFYELYAVTFGDLATKAVARQVLYEHEFMEIMADERVDKYLGRDAAGLPVSMCTLTRHLDTVPWISPEYFTHHYPEHAARDAVYYLGFILVSHRHRRERVFADMVRSVAETLVERRAMCAYDICGHNVHQLRLADSIGALLRSVADIDVRVIDEQLYYQAVPMGPLRRPSTGGVPS